MQLRERVDLDYQAEIVVDEERWFLRFALPVYDRRYTPEFVHIYSNEVPFFRKALVDGFAKYTTLKPILSGDAEFEDTFGRVTLRVRGHFDGVCIGGHYVLFKTAEAMDSATSPPSGP